MRSDLIPVTLDGLFDPMGIYGSFSAEECWAPNPPQPVSEQVQTAIPADALSEALFVPPDHRPAVATAPFSAVVILNDARDFPALITLVTAMPNVKFTVLTALRHRGIEKNLYTVYPREASSAIWDDAQLLIQFSTRHVALAAESIVWIERARRLIAAAQCAPGSELATHFYQIEDPQNTNGWIRAVQAIAKRFARDRMLVLSD
jgi:hypothetical protein